MTDANGKAFRKVNKGGRPGKLTPALMDSICLHIRHGAYIETAAAANGIDKVTFYAWLKKGHENPQSIFGKFSNAVHEAMAMGEISDLEAITAARAKNWQAAAWRLQRRYPGRWAATHRPPVAPEQDDDSDFNLAYDLEKE